MSVFLIAVLIAIILATVSLKDIRTSTSEISYTQFLNKVQTGKIESVLISKESLIAIPKEEKSSENKKTPAANTVQQNLILAGQQLPKTQYKVQIPENDKEMYDLLKDNSVEITLAKTQDGSWMGLLGTVIIPIIFIIIMIAR